MSRLIDADELIPLIKMGEMNEYTEFGDGRNSGIAFAVERINQMPTVEPERKAGKWIYGEHDISMCDGYWCDKCGFFVPWDYQHKSIDFINDYHFCPNCGADMRGGDSE